MDFALIFNTMIFKIKLFSFVGLLTLLMPAEVLAQTKLGKLNLRGMMQPLENHSINRDSAYYNWGASIIKGDDGLYHLFYSRWKKKYTFSGWLTFSEIAHSVASSPTGPWQYKDTALKSGEKGRWDEISAHNPKIEFFDGKYYLYYIATNFGGKSFDDQTLEASNGKSLSDKNRRILRENQRTGVAVSTTLEGPWQRLDSPIIEPSGPIETLTVNPAICKGGNGIYYLIVKGDKPNEPGFVRNQAIALSNSPTGPFEMQEKPVIGDLDTEDVSIWYDSDRKKFFAVFHAHTYIGLINSTDGLNWTKAENYIVTEKKIRLSDGSFLIPDRMERPFVYVEENEPKVLCLAIKKGDDSYTVFIPLSKKMLKR